MYRSNFYAHFLGSAFSNEMLPNSLIKLLVLPLRNTQNSLNDIIKLIKRYNFPRLRLNQWSIRNELMTYEINSEIIQNMPIVGGVERKN